MAKGRSEIIARSARSAVPRINAAVKSAAIAKRRNRLFRPP
jgi:hypothetical protein